MSALIVWFVTIPQHMTTQLDNFWKNAKRLTSHNFFSLHGRLSFKLILKSWKPVSSKVGSAKSLVAMTVLWMFSISNKIFKTQSNRLKPQKIILVSRAGLLIERTDFANRHFLKTQIMAEMTGVFVKSNEVFLMDESDFAVQQSNWLTDLEQPLSLTFSGQESPQIYEQSLRNTYQTPHCA